MAPKTKIAKLYDTVGIRDEGFVKELSSFFKYLQIRYRGRCEDEVEAELYFKFYVAMDEYYDPKKCNITTFIYSLARNTISTFNYRDKVSKNRNLELDDYASNIGAPDFNLHLMEELAQAMSGFKRISIMGEHSDIFHPRIPEDAPLVKYLTWQRTKNALF